MIEKSERLELRLSAKQKQQIKNLAKSFRAITVKNTNKPFC